MNKYLIFRTDRLGDFLITLILINSIKKNDPSSFITVVASEYNYSYIKSFKTVDDVVLFKKNILSKIKLIFRLRNYFFDYIILHDNKERSLYLSFFLKYTQKIKINNNLNSHIEIIKNLLHKLNFKFSNSDLNILYRKYKSFSNLKDYIVFHFDEKWFSKTYIKKYDDISPTIKDLKEFFILLSKKTNKKIVVTTGRKSTKLLKLLSNLNFNKKLIFLFNQNYFDLEKTIFNSSLLISCHGFVSHIAAAKNIKQIDLIDRNNKKFYKKWTDHFRNYNFLYRKNFKILYKEILFKIK